MIHKDFRDFTPEALGFKQIPNFSDYYASRSGNVYSMKSGFLVKKKIYNAKDGYCTVGLTMDGQTDQRRYKLHTIIGRTWLPNPLGKVTVNHINGKETRNNSVANLEWATHGEQITHAYATGLIKRKASPVCQADKEGILIEEFGSMKEASTKTGVSLSMISATCQGKYRMAGGFVWYHKKDFKGQKMRKFGTCKTVHKFSKDGKFLQEFESVNEAAKHMKVHPGTMADACRGKQKTCKGYRWAYAPKEKKSDPLETYKDWVTLKNFPKYRISKDGQVYSFFHNKILSPSTKKNKVQTLGLTNKEGICKKMGLHQLVALAYLPNPETFPLVKHLDDNPSNNKVENLEWGNHSTNGLDAYETGINSNVHPVIKYSLKGKELSRYKSINKAAKDVGVGRTAISQALNGRSKTCGGFVWKYDI